MDEKTLLNGSGAATAGNTEPTRRRGHYLSIVIIAALFLVGTLQTLTGAKGSVSSEINDQYLGVAGTYGTAAFVELATITDVQLVDPFDFGTCLDGEETGNTVSGTYSCEAYGEYTVHAYTNKPCIVVSYPGGILVFNRNSESNTEKLFEQIAAAAPAGH